MNPSQSHCDGEPLKDWLVWFAHKVAMEREYIAHHPGARFCVMLQREEAEGLLAQIIELPGAEEAEGGGA